MTDYAMQWVTDDVAAGHAPMSYDQLDVIRNSGVGAIVNLCGEYCDLHEIQMQQGFEVHYLPIPDECAPDMHDIDHALDWVDAAIGRGLKVLVHCRFGIGRTGTFLMAYLMRHGLDMKAAEKALRKTPASPAKYCQWKFLRQFKKKI